MSTSLFTALSGLRSFESWLDVIGNNIANANTTGFRGSRASFGDLLSLTLSPGSGPTDTVGGKNPAQIGLGVSIKSIDQDTNSGSLLATGRNLDLTVFGSGLFVVSDGSRDFYTRAGTFGFDARGQLVELGTGYLVQSITKSSIVVAPNAIAPPNPTSEITMKGNLPAKVTGPLKEIVSTESPFQTGTAAEITGTAAQPFALTNADSMTIQVDSGPPQTITFVTTDFANIATATAAEVAAVINNQTSDITAADVGGQLVITSNAIGSESSLKITNVTNSPATTLGLTTVLVAGTQSQANTNTDLNDLVSNSTDYVVGDGIDVTGSLADGTQFAGTFTYGVDGTTLESLRAFTQNLVTDGTVEIDVQGNIIVTADAAGEASYAIKLTDSPGNTGASDFTDNEFIVTQQGTDPDQVNTAITVYDKNGEGHVLSMTFERVNSNTWNLVADLPDGGGTVIDAIVDNIRFNEDGSLQSTGDTNLEILFANTGTQAISLDFGKDIDGVTQFGGPATVQAIEQDGYTAGTLADIVVTESGEVLGVFTNGQTRGYGEIALANFANPGGLKREGGNLFSDTVNSGVAQISAGGGPGGTIQAGVLETSNVDLAEEFVHMIEAQRGYQASARVVQASEQLLQSLLQNI